VIAEDIGSRMFGPEEAATDRRLRDEVDNLRAARDLAPVETRVAITLAVSRVVTWRDYPEIWAWAGELADDPALGAHPQRTAILAAAAEAARLVGDLGTAQSRADEAIAVADPDRDGAALSQALAVVAVVAHFRGDFDTARDTWLRAAETEGDEACAVVGSAALAAAYGGDPADARRLLERARTMIGCGTDRAFVAYVEGELRATTHPEESIPCYARAIAEAARVGCHFVEGIARVSLASAQARVGDVPSAAQGFGDLIALWRRTGQTTQLWTTARNAAGLLASAGRRRTAALLLICAESIPGAAAVDEEIARFSGRSFTPVDDLVDTDELVRLREEAARLGPAEVLDLAQAELGELGG
jgi:hypothetical protein